MVPVTVSVELDTFPAGQRTMYFPGEHASEMDFQTLKGREGPGKNQGPGERTGCRPLFLARGSRARRAKPMPKNGFLRGDSGQCSTCVALRLALAETPPICSEGENTDQAS